MATLQLTLTLEQEGRPITDSPIVRERSAPLARTFSYDIQPGAGVTLIPFFSGFTQITDLVFTTTGRVVCYLNGQTAGGVELATGGVLVALGLSATTQVPLWQVTNPELVATRIRGVVLGTP